MTQKLIIFDVDGTLADSQAMIVNAMQGAFTHVGRPAPDRAAVLGIVGLSLDIACARLAPDADTDTVHALATAYRDTANAMHDAQKGAGEPFFDGIRPLLDQLHADPGVVLAIATGKSKRGTDRLIAYHGLSAYFDSVQTADFHPSKPHPSMILQVLEDTGIAAENTVMIGDTSYDIDMARAAGVSAISVGWGYHDAAHLRADHHARSPAELEVLINAFTAG